MSIQADMPGESNGDDSDQYRGKHLHNAISISCDSATSPEVATQLPLRCHEAPIASPASARTDALKDKFGARLTGPIRP
jgi:hypothetical protein